MTIYNHKSPQVIQTQSLVWLADKDLHLCEPQYCVHNWLCLQQWIRFIELPWWRPWYGNTSSIAAPTTTHQPNTHLVIAFFYEKTHLCFPSSLNTEMALIVNICPRVWEEFLYPVQPTNHLATQGAGASHQQPWYKSCLSGFGIRTDGSRIAAIVRRITVVCAVTGGFHVKTSTRLSQHFTTWQNMPYTINRLSFVSKVAMSCNLPEIALTNAMKGSLFPK